MRSVRPLRLLATSLAFSGTFLAAFFLIAHASMALEPAATVRFVAKGGSDAGNLCIDSSLPCASIQHGVDVASSGDEVRIATGVYTGMHSRPAPAGYQGPALITQVVHLTKTLFLRGGFSPADWTVQDPEHFPTVVDAESKGRALFMAGPITPTLDGLVFLNGNATGLGGGALGNMDSGGNVAIYMSGPTVRNCSFIRGTAQIGGGLWLAQGKGLIDHSRFLSNTAANGAGFIAGASSGLLTGNLFSGNVAGATGGGLLLVYSDMTLVNNAVVRNRTLGDVSGIGVGGSTATLIHTTVSGNTGGNGAGITINEFLSVPSQTIMTNTILVNQTVGITVGVSSRAQMDAVLLSGNGVDAGGLGVIAMTHVYTGNPALAADGYHLTAASAAIDRGLDVGVREDIDRARRPLGRAPDLGADEYPRYLLFLPVLLK